MPATDPRVDAFIATLPDWQQDFARHIRRLIHIADPEVQETIKRTNRPYFVLDGNVAAFLGAKDHLNVFIYDPLTPDPHGLINQGQANTTARAIQLRRGDVINDADFIEFIRQIIKNNRAGGWRKLQSGA